MENVKELTLKDLSLEPDTADKTEEKILPEKDIKPVKLIKKKRSLKERLEEIGTINPKEVVEFTRHLSVMLSAGVTIFEAINFLKDQSKNKSFARKLEVITESLNNGQALSGAMKRFPKIFPGIYTNIVRVGERSGTLAETMGDLADHLEENEKFKSKVKGALIYPKIIMIVMIFFLFVIFFFVMPRILTIFTSLDAEIPAATKVVIWITNFLQDRILLLSIGIVGVIILYKLLLRNDRISRFRDMVYIKLPFIGHIILNYNTTQVSQHFGTLYASGLTIINCLETTQSVIKNKIFQDEIRYMVDKIKSGSSFSQSFKDKSEFPPMFIKLIKVGERTGKLPHVIEYMKDYYKSLVDTDVKNITTIIEPVIMVVLGLIVAGLVITVIGPIYQLIANIGV